jgi:CheY-like chemotaxis protein
MPTAKRKMLIVENDNFLSYILAARFRRAGFNAVSADSLDEALGLLPDFRPDVVLTGVKLGDDSGYDLLDQVRSWQEKTGRPARVVMIDRLKDPVAYDRSKAKGADGYIAKTAASFEDMLKVISRIL